MLLFSFFHFVSKTRAYSEYESVQHDIIEPW